jgi:putative transcriptional regulator
VARRESLIAARKARGFTQQTLADAVGVRVLSVARWERGNIVPSLHLAIRLARVLGVTVEELFGDEADDNEAAAA